jgi:O-acetyl-ADP-ribose deacetylase (regulator of RNase III)
MQLEEVEGDLLDQDVEAIVNAWNRNIVPWWLLLPQGVSGAIKRRAGTAPFREVMRHGPIELGGAVVTSAGRLPHKAIIHVAGINLLWTATEESIRKSVRSAMRLVDERGFRSVGFPAIGAGSGRFDEKRSVDLIRKELDQQEYDGRVVLVRFRRQ